MKKPLVSIVIPTYNERENILELVPAILGIANRLTQYRFELVIVDDDSPDGTAAAVKRRFGKNPAVRVFLRKGQRGLGEAILHGIRKAKGEIIVGMDADFNHDPASLPLLLDALRTSTIAIASRFIPGGGMDDRLRYTGTLLFNLFLRIVLRFPSSDNASGYYAIRKIDLGKLGVERIYFGYGEYHLRLLHLAKRQGFTFSEVPVYYPRRRHGVSKSRLLRMAITYIVEAFRLLYMSGNATTKPPSASTHR